MMTGANVQQLGKTLYLFRLVLSTLEGIWRYTADVYNISFLKYRKYFITTVE